MPFSDLNGITEQEWTDAYDELFRPAIEDAGLNYISERSEIRNGAFTKDIVENLKSAHVVLADITHFNANVMWELGVRHALSKRTIMVARHDVMQTISDMKIYGVIPYNSITLKESNNFKRKIKGILNNIESDPERSDNPVFDFLRAEELVLSTTEKNRLISNLTGLLSELFFDLNFAEGVLSGYYKVEITETTLERFKFNAMSYLLSTNYISTDESYFKLIRNINNRVESINRRIELILLDKRLDLDFKHSDVIKKDCPSLILNIKNAINKTKELLSSVRKGTFEYSEPPILLIKDEHKQLLQD